MTSTRYLAALISALVLASSASEAVAQDLSDTEIERFQAHMKEGGQAYKDGRFQDSIDALRSAQEIFDHPDITYNIARSLTELRQCSEAQRLYLGYIQRSDISDEDSAKAREMLRRLEKCDESATITVTCVQPDVLISLDGAAPQACPAELNAQPGDHTIAATGPGLQPRRFDVALAPAAVATVEVVLQAPPESTESSSRGPSMLTLAGWGGVGIGGALVVAGLLTDLASRSIATDLQQAADGRDFEAIDSLRKKARSNRTRAILFYTSGLVIGAAGGVTVWYVGTRSEPAAGVAFSGVW